MINCLSSVETKRLVFSVFKAIAVIPWPSPSFSTWNTYRRRIFGLSKDNSHDIKSNLVFHINRLFEYTWRVYKLRKQIEGDGIFNLSTSLLLLDESSSPVRILKLFEPSMSENEFTPITTFCPSMDSSMQLMVQEEGSLALEMSTPLMVNVLIQLSNLLQTTITPSEEMQRAWASTPTSRLISRPFLIECNRTSDDSEHETTIPWSELTQQQLISLWCPRSTCMGPSMRCFLALFAKLLLLAEEGVAELVVCSGSLVWEVNPLWNLHNKTVVSREPVTRKLLSGDRARHVTGAQWPKAVSSVFASSDETILMLLSTCPPN